MDFWLWIGSFVLIFCNSCVNHARRHLLPFHRWWKLRGVKWPSQDQTADKQHVPGFSDPKPNSFGWSMMLLRSAPSSHSCPEVFGFTGERLSHYWLACLWCLLEVTHYRLRLFYEDCTFSLVSYVTSRKIILCCCSNQSLQQESVREKRSRASQGNPETAVERKAECSQLISWVCERGCRAEMIQGLLEELCLKLTCNKSLLFEMFILQLTKGKERVNFPDSLLPHGSTFEWRI